MLCRHYRPTATALYRQKAASAYFTSEQVQPFGFAKRAMIRHMCIGHIYPQWDHVGVFNIQTQETEKTKLCAAGFPPVDETTPSLKAL